MIGVERPSDWSALGFDCDPVPGDPVAVRAGAVSWTALADQISHCAQSLRALEAGASRGADSVAALLEARDEIVDQVGVMEARYRQAGAALEEYAVVLDRAQSESLQAWYAARDAQGELDAAVGRSESFTRSAQDAGVAGDDEEQARCTRLAGAAEADAACARGRIAAQQQVVTAAVEQRDTAAVRAMGLIAAAKDADGVADSWWDDWGRTVVKWMTALAEAVGAITGVLALVIGWIPILGQAVSGVFLTISVILGTVAAIGHTALWLAGDEELLTVLVSVALALVGLGALKGAARLGTAMCKGMLKHVEFLARAKGAASSVLGKVGLRALLRPGGVPAILRYRFRNAMVGQLGEESMLVGLWPKVRYAMSEYAQAVTRNTRVPDLTIRLFGNVRLGEVKFIRDFSPVKRLCEQMADYSAIAARDAGDGLVHIFRPEFYTDPKTVSKFMEWATGKDVGIHNLAFHSLEEYVVLRAATEINVTCQFGQGVNHYFSGWGG